MATKYVNEELLKKYKNMSDEDKKKIDFAKLSEEERLAFRMSVKPNELGFDSQVEGV